MVLTSGMGMVSTQPIIRPQLLPVLGDLLSAGVEVEHGQQRRDDPVGEFHESPFDGTAWLTLTLRNLERAGLVARTVYAEVPPRVEYALTSTGKSLIPPALALAGWAMEHVPHIEASRAAYQTRNRG
jgi:hypothetical protein